MELLAALVIIPLTMACASLLVKDLKLLGTLVAIAMVLNLIATSYIVLPMIIYPGDLYKLIAGLQIDRVSAIFVLLTASVSALTATHSYKFFQTEKKKKPGIDASHINIYYFFSLLFHVSMVFVFLCDNLGYLWICIEATTLISASLVYFYRDKHALEAVWKYLIICSVGIAFALFGTVCFYIASKYGGSTEGTLAISELIAMAAQLEPTYAKLGFILCFLGYGTKAGIFPLHSWLPDAHSEAPAPASAMLSGSLLNCALYAIYKISAIGIASKDHLFCQQLLLWAGTITVAAASLFLVRQHGLKRLWAYSSIENVGLILVAIGLNSLPVILLQAINHSLVKASLFLVSGDIIQKTGTKEISEIKGLWKSMPLEATLLAISAIAITGAPPFGAFISEWMLLAECAQQGRWLILSVVAISLTIAFTMVTYHLGRMLSGAKRDNGPGVHRWSLSMAPICLILASLALGLFVSPSLLELLR